MDVNAIVTLISSVGFPIVCSGALFWLLTQQSKEHKEEMNLLKESIDELKIAIVTLTNKMENRNGY